MKKLLKKKDGFTLVELIVVIAILAILAGVAIPAYSGYISKANEAADYVLLDEVLTAVQFAVIDANNSATLNSITLGTNAKAVTVSCTATSGTAPTSVDISSFIGMDTISFKSGATGATWSASESKWTLTK